MHLPAHVVDVVVHHWQGDADREDCDHREGDGRVGHEAVSLEDSILVEANHNREDIITYTLSKQVSKQCLNKHKNMQLP